MISLKKRYESFLPEFDLVKERATEAATAQAVRQAVSDRAEELQINLAAALEAGTSFADAAAAEKLTVQTTAEFDLSKQLENDYAETLVPLCLQKQEGELCNVVPVADGVLVSFVKTRTTTPVEEGLPAVREELIRSLEQNRAQQLAFDWQSSLLKEANFSRN